MDTLILGPMKYSLQNCQCFALEANAIDCRTASHLDRASDCFVCLQTLTPYNPGSKAGLLAFVEAARSLINLPGPWMNVSRADIIRGLCLYLPLGLKYLQASVALVIHR